VSGCFEHGLRKYLLSNEGLLPSQKGLQEINCLVMNEVQVTCIK
jgi:hypothetical protein